MTKHVTITLTEREAEEMESGIPDERAWKSIRRKCKYALHILREDQLDESKPKPIK